VEDAMDVHAQVDLMHEAVQRIVAVARRTECPLFLDLLGWRKESYDIFSIIRNPGVMFESPHRVVVFQEVCGELRYYAGGWRSNESRIYLEEARIEAEGHERGIFETVSGAIEFTERYLVEAACLQAIDVPRRLLSRRETTIKSPATHDR
jgi:hypothetical protein